MYNSAFTKKTLARELRRKDFIKDKSLLSPLTLELLIENSYKSKCDNLNSLSFLRESHRRKPVYKAANLENELVIRKINRNIKALTKVRQADRNQIVQSLIRLLKETSPYRIYRLDIKSFYESIDLESLYKRVYIDSGVSRETAKLLRAFLNKFKSTGNPGIPRGISLSATLAEYVMRDFDQRAQKHKEVFFYSRFVDDIVIITSGAECELEFLHQLESILHTGLIFNTSPQKKQIEYINEGSNHQFAFLGYDFRISPPSTAKGWRTVSVGLADNKIKKLKSRICTALMDFNKNHNFLLLQTRIRALSSNYEIYDYDKKLKRMTGIFYNYPYLDNYAGLKELDNFLRQAVRKPITKNLPHIVFTSAQQKSLLKYSFTKGHSQKITHYFQTKKIDEIMRCWLYA